MESNGFKKLFLLILCSIFVLSVLINMNTYINIKVGNNENIDLDNHNLELSKISGKIHINNNWSDAKTAGICTGSGTESDPYLIEDLEIDGGGTGNCILIENSEDYFRIENCFVSNWGDSYYDAGIKLFSVHNGNLTNNRATSPDGYGITLENCINNLIVRNVVRTHCCMRLFQSNSNVIYLNDAEATYFDLEYRMSNNNRFHTPKRMVYIYNDNRYKSFLGNFWEGYGGPDNNNDGIGDEPRIFDTHLPSGQWVYIDYYPLMDNVENYEILGVASTSEDGIPGYSLIFLVGLVSITTIILFVKLKKSIK